MSPPRSLTENQRGILYMVVACTGFVANDTLVKLASADLPIAQIIVLRSLLALPFVVLLCWWQGALANLIDFESLHDRHLWLRTFGEIGGTATFLTALAHLELASISAIAQLTPLAVTAAAAILLGEKVGIRRWSAILIGFLAVLLIIRPGGASFNAWSLLALSCVGFVVLRDLSSRAMSPSIHPLTVTVVSLAALVPLGAAMSWFAPWAELQPRALAYCVGSAAALSFAYALMVQAMRYGEVSVVAPFRYVVLIWAIVFQVTIFAVWPDVPTVVGSLILIATGLYTVYRERKVKGAGAPLDSAPKTVPPPT